MIAKKISLKINFYLCLSKVERALIFIDGFMISVLNKYLKLSFLAEWWNFQYTSGYPGFYMKWCLSSGKSKIWSIK